MTGAREATRPLLSQRPHHEHRRGWTKEREFFALRDGLWRVLALIICANSRADFCSFFICLLCSYYTQRLHASPWRDLRHSKLLEELHQQSPRLVPWPG